MSVRAPVGDLNVAFESCCIGWGLGAIRSKWGHQSFILYKMMTLKEQLDIFNGEGTVFGAISKDTLHLLPIEIPPIEKIERFECIVSPMDAAIRKNFAENTRLAAIREVLLPRLMSGEIDVSEVEL